MGKREEKEIRKELERIMEGMEAERLADGQITGVVTNKDGTVDGELRLSNFSFKRPILDVFIGLQSYARAMPGYKLSLVLIRPVSEPDEHITGLIWIGNIWVGWISMHYAYIGTDTRLLQVIEDGIEIERHSRAKKRRRMGVLLYRLRFD